MRSGLEGVPHRDELGGRFGHLGVRVGTRDDATSREQPGGGPVQLGTAQGDRPVTIAAGVQPADRRGVPFPVHRLQLRDRIQRALSRCATDGCRRVYGRDQVEDIGSVGHDGADIGGEVGDVAELQGVRLRRYVEIPERWSIWIAGEAA